MAQTVPLSPDAAHDLVIRALMAHKTGPRQAALTAAALVRAETDEQPGHGLSRVPSYAAQAAAGKVDGFAEPSAERVRPGLLRVDAHHGFAFPAIDLALSQLPDMTAGQGIAAAALTRSHHFGQAGAPVEHLAEQGLVALAFTNSPKAIAPHGGARPMLGTNPIAFACPLADRPPLVIDLSLSVAARGKIMAAGQRGAAIPEGWALDADGRPTTDPEAALAGSMLAIGGAKGAALALMVELLTAALTGSHFATEASSFFDTQGGPPGIGHLILAIDPAAVSGGSFAVRAADFAALVEAEPGGRLAGTRRLAARARAAEDGLAIPVALVEQIRARATSG